MQQNITIDALHCVDMAGGNGKETDPTKSLAQMVQERLTFNLEDNEGTREGEEWRDRLQPLGEMPAIMTKHTRNIN